MKTPIPNVVFTGVFVWGGMHGVAIFVGSESGQKQSVKIQQKMVYNAVRLLWEGGRIGGGQRESGVTIVHKRGRKYQHYCLCLQSINSIKYQ